MTELTLYIHGCRECGKTGKDVAILQRFCWNNSINLTVKDSRFSDAIRAEHANAMQDLNLSMATYKPVVEAEDGSLYELATLDYSTL